MKTRALPLFLFLVISLVGSAAHAGFDCEGSFKQALCATLAFSISPYEASVLASWTSMGPLERVAYVQNLRDDAAQFVADDSAGTSALLGEAIRHIRELDPETTKLTDVEVSREILKDL